MVNQASPQTKSICRMRSTLPTDGPRCRPAGPHPPAPRPLLLGQKRDKSTYLALTYIASCRCISCSLMLCCLSFTLYVIQMHPCHTFAASMSDCPCSRYSRTCPPRKAKLRSPPGPPQPSTPRSTATQSWLQSPPIPRNLPLWPLLLTGRAQ